MNKHEATILATSAVDTVTVGNPEPVFDSTVVYKSSDGTFSVVDNGEEVDGLDKENAIRVIVENLTQGDGEPENFAKSIYETPDTWGNETEYADGDAMEKTIASLDEVGIDGGFGDCNEWELVESYGTSAIYTLLRVRKDRFGVFSAKGDREGFYELIDEAETLDEAREEIEEQLGNNGHANFEGHHYIFDTQAVLTNGVFAGWFGDAEDGEEYTTQYAATGYRDDGTECRIFFEFSAIKGEEPEDESDYPWDDEHVARVSPL